MGQKKEMASYSQATLLDFAPILKRVPRKRELTTVERALYWLDWGRNADKLYDPQEGYSFTKRIANRAQQELIRNSLDTAVLFYGGKLRREQLQSTSPHESPTIRITSNVTRRRGNPAVIIRQKDGIQFVQHTWIKSLPREQRLGNNHISS